MNGGAGPGTFVLIVEVRPRLVRRAIALSVAAASAMLLGTWAFALYYRTLTVPWNEAHPIRHALVHLSLGAENVVAAWFSSMLLLSVAGACAIAFTVDGTAGASRRMLRAGWLVLALLFVALSFDELGSIHERLSMVTIGAGNETLIGWYALIVGLIAAVSFMLAFGLLHVRQVMPAFLLLALGAMCFASVPVQEHLEVQAYREAGNGWIRPIGWLLLEEGSELAGAICSLAAALVYSSTRLARLSTGEGSVSLALPWRRTASLVVLALVVLGAGLAVSQVQFGGSAGAHGHGIPRNWFPAMLAFTTAAFAWWLGGAGDARVLRAFAPIQLVASAFVGADLHGWKFLAMPSLGVRIAFAATIAAVIGIAMLRAFRATRLSASRPGVAAWGVLLYLGMATTWSGAVAPLVFASSGVLLFVLLAHLAGETCARQAAQHTGDHGGTDHRSRRHVLQAHE